MNPDSFESVIVSYAKSLVKRFEDLQQRKNLQASLFAFEAAELQKELDSLKPHAGILERHKLPISFPSEDAKSKAPSLAELPRRETQKVNEAQHAGTSQENVSNGRV